MGEAKRRRLAAAATTKKPVPPDSPKEGVIVITISPPPWKEDDRLWFAAHPRRRWRLREPIDEELAVLRCASSNPLGAGQINAWLAAGRRMGIAVYQIEPGCRQRFPIRISTDDPLDSFTDAGITKTIRGLREEAESLRRRFSAAEPVAEP
jgi:hypothetical protein